MDKENKIENYEMPLRWGNSDKDLREKCEKAAHRLYGKLLPEEVRIRLGREIDAICSYGYETLYLTVSSLISGMGLRKSEYNFRGCCGNSFVAYLLGISGAVNPLSPHYRCSDGHYTEFCYGKTSYGYDLPDKICPICGKKLKKDGFSLTEKFFMGEDGSKKPDFEINIVSWKKEEALRVLGYMKGVGQIVGCSNPDEGKPTLCRPNGVMLIPEYAGEAKGYLDIISGFNGEMISRTDYYEVDHIFSKIGILHNSQTDHLARVEDLVGISVDNIPLDDKETVVAFTSLSVFLCFMLLFIAGGRDSFRQETGGKGHSPFWGLLEQTLCLLSFWVPEIEVVKSKGFSQYNEKLQKKKPLKIHRVRPLFLCSSFGGLLSEYRRKGFHRNLPGGLIIINPLPGKNQYYIFLLKNI